MNAFNTMTGGIYCNSRMITTTSVLSVFVNDQISGKSRVIRESNQFVIDQMGVLPLVATTL